MAMKAALSNSKVLIQPSKQLVEYIRSIKNCTDMPQRIISLCANDITPIDETLESIRPSDIISDEDRDFLKSLPLNSSKLHADAENTELETTNVPLRLEDLLWLWNKLKDAESGSNLENPYLHQLLLGSKIILPENDIIPRSEDLDRRCQLLKAQQANREYKAMTKNVDCVRKPLPEDTISYQVQQINKQLIAVVQFIVSVLAGFAFGFLGVELMVGSLDFGFRLLLGVICSLIIALAELYFLAKKLNEDLQYEISAENKTAHSKIN